MTSYDNNFLMSYKNISIKFSKQTKTSKAVSVSFSQTSLGKNNLSKSIRVSYKTKNSRISFSFRS